MQPIRDQRLRFSVPDRRGVRGDPDPATARRIEWLQELVEEFGPNEVSHWFEPPPGWTFDEWESQASIHAELPQPNQN